MKTRNLFRLAAVFAVPLVAVAGACSSDSGPGSKAGTFYGTAQNIGGGTARTFVELNAAGEPVTLGIALTEGALSNLPTATTPPNPASAMLVLALPGEASGTGFDHAEVQYNPNGHDPVQFYGVPHFDLHFYQAPVSAEMAIVPSDPDWTTKASNLPTADYVPAGYITPPGSAVDNTIPMMGLHWLDTKAPELNGQAFTKTFLYGSYDGQFMFFEPMITVAYLETHPNVTQAIPQPSKWAKAGYYPTTFSVDYDAGAKEYRIALSGLTARGQ